MVRLFNPDRGGQAPGLFSGAGRAMCPRCARKGARHATGFGCRLSASVRGGAPAPRQPRAVLRVVRFRRRPARPKAAFIKAATGRRRLTGRPTGEALLVLPPSTSNPTQRPFALVLREREGVSSAGEPREVSSGGGGRPSRRWRGTAWFQRTVLVRGTADSAALS